MSLTSRRTVMTRKRYKPEEIVAKLRQVDVLVSQGQNMADAIRQIGVSEVTYYRWRQECGGLKTEQVWATLFGANGAHRARVADRIDNSRQSVCNLKAPLDRTRYPGTASLRVGSFDTLSPVDERKHPHMIRRLMQMLHRPVYESRIHELVRQITKWLK